ncbi:hypothetical protein K502DRAFT_251472 [Neoconidiobolus thromboides FSU 785]|nr:hypothetical protein K502DRAFT_251472 [Neoconidiobolus thromboides FSU 785]
MSLIEAFKKWPLASLAIYNNEPNASNKQNKSKIEKQKWNSDYQNTLYAVYYPIELNMKLITINQNISSINQMNLIDTKDNNNITIIETIPLSKMEIEISKLRATIKGLTMNFKYYKFFSNFKNQTIKIQIRLLNEDITKDILNYLKSHIEFSLSSSDSTDNTLTQSEVNVETLFPAISNATQFQNNTTLLKNTQDNILSATPYQNHSSLAGNTQDEISNYILSPFIDNQSNSLVYPPMNHNELNDPYSTQPIGDETQGTQSYFLTQENQDKINNKDTNGSNIQQ